MFAVLLVLSSVSLLGYWVSMMQIYGTNACTCVWLMGGGVVNGLR